MSLSNIILVRPSSSDFLAIAKLVDHSFAHEEFGVVAFGPKRLTPAGAERRAKKFTNPSNPGETKHEMMAVMALPDGTKEIVGFASWIICVGRGGSDEEKAKLGTREGWAHEEKEKEKKEKMAEGMGKEDEEGHGNPKLRKYFAGEIDKILARSAEGKDYMILNLLVVSPQQQRQGIGGLLFAEGLRVADEAGLQVILGASDQGIGLYKKYGCIEVGIFEVNLWEYEGGQGLGVATNHILHRPAVSRKSAQPWSEA